MNNSSAWKSNSRNHTQQNAEFKILIDNYFAAGNAAWNGDVTAPQQFYAKEVDAIYYDIFAPLGGYNGWKAFAASVNEAIDRNRDIGNNSQ